LRPQQYEIARALAAAAWLTLIGACLPAVKPPAPVTCAPPCGVVREVTFPDTMAVGVHVAPGTRLRNASVASQGTSACASGVPVVLVTVDELAYREGPAALGRTSSLLLRFPFDSKGSAPEAPVIPPVVVDLDLEGPTGGRCLRLPLPDAGTGLMASVRKLSLRLETREGDEE
jgi:hypothetical protein